MFKAVIGRPIGWDLIDAISHLEEREEALRDGREPRSPNSEVRPKNSVQGRLPYLTFASTSVLR